MTVPAAYGNNAVSPAVHSTIPEVRRHQQGEYEQDYVLLRRRTARVNSTYASSSRVKMVMPISLINLPDGLDC